MKAIYLLQDVGQIYSGRDVLRIDELAIEENKILGIIGPNGSGKSTLLRILAFVESPAFGLIMFDGERQSANGSLIRRSVTMLMQEPYLLKRSVNGNVKYGLKIRGQKRTDKEVAQALEMVGLDPDRFGRRSWYELSGGEAQRVAMASRLVMKPRVLLLDEPTSNLDKESASLIQQASLQARRQWGATLIIVSHNIEWLEAVSDRIIRMKDGRMVLTD
jgi:tungstate transport system ATP-binding protein